MKYVFIIYNKLYKQIKYYNNMLVNLIIKQL